MSAPPLIISPLHGGERGGPLRTAWRARPAPPRSHRLASSRRGSVAFLRSARIGSAVRSGAPSVTTIVGEGRSLKSALMTRCYDVGSRADARRPHGDLTRRSRPAPASSTGVGGCGQDVAGERQALGGGGGAVPAASLGDVAGAVGGDQDRMHGPRHPSGRRPCRSSRSRRRSCATPDPGTLRTERPTLARDLAWRPPRPCSAGSARTRRRRSGRPRRSRGTAARSVRAIAASSTLPASWPRRSLKPLKSSRSTISRLNGVPRLTAICRYSWNVPWFLRPVSGRSGRGSPRPGGPAAFMRAIDTWPANSWMSSNSCVVEVCVRRPGARRPARPPPGRGRAAARRSARGERARRRSVRRAGRSSAFCDQLRLTVPDHPARHALGCTLDARVPCTCPRSGPARTSGAGRCASSS